MRDRLAGEAALTPVVRRARVVGMEEVGDLPPRGGGARTAQVVRVHVRVDHGGGRRVERPQQLVVTLQVTARVDDDRVAVAHQHVRQGALAHAVELHDPLHRWCGGEEPRQIDRLPRGHPAGDGVRVEALRTEEQRRLPARVPVSAHHGDRPAGIERQRVEARERVHLRGGEGTEIERRPQAHGALRDALAGADVEQLQRLTAVEALRELVGRHLGQRGAGHGEECRRRRAKAQPRTGLGRSPVLRAVRLL